MCDIVPSESLRSRSLYEKDKTKTDYKLAETAVWAKQSQLCVNNT